MDKRAQGGFARDIAMDLGTTSVLVAIRGRGILLQEPAVVAVARRTGQVLQVGQAARQMLGRTPGELVAVRPLREGIIDRCTVAEAMVRAFCKKPPPAGSSNPGCWWGSPRGSPRWRSGRWWRPAYRRGPGGSISWRNPWPPP